MLVQPVSWYLGLILESHFGQTVCPVVSSELSGSFKPNVDFLLMVFLSIHLVDDGDDNYLRHGSQMQTP